MTPKEMIMVEKEVYEAVLRNSIRVNDLEAENQQLRKWCEEFNALDVAKENKQLKDLLKECRKALNKAKGDTVWYPVEIDHVLTQIDNAIGEKK
jgi:hypothetical protein